MHIVMIVGGYYPNPSPTGKCAEQYINLIQEGHDVDVVCIGRSDRFMTIFNGKTIHQTSSPYWKFQQKLNNRRSLSILYQLTKVPVHFLDQFRHPNNLYWYSKYAYIQLMEIHKKQSIDLIFSVGAPMAAHCAAAKFRNEFPSVRWITYSVDSYAAQNGNKQKFIKFESDILSQADHNFLSEEIYHNSPFLYETFSDAVTPLPYLLPRITNVRTHTFFDEGKIHCVYAGSFYQKIRNPKFLLEVFSLLHEDIVLHLYCTSDCDQLIDSAVANSDGKIIRHKPVGLDEILRIYMEADILVNVGNSLPEFKPSKTFEYISTGKPILDIYYEGQQDDVLKKYPLVLQISNRSEISEVVSPIEEFIRKNNNKSVSRQDIDCIYEKNSEVAIGLTLRDKFFDISHH